MHDKILKAGIKIKKNRTKSISNVCNFFFQQKDNNKFFTFHLIFLKEYFEIDTRTSFDAYLLPTNLDAHCSASSFHVPRFFLFFSFSFFTYYEIRERAPEIYAVGGEFRLPRYSSFRETRLSAPPREFSKFVPLSKDISETRRGGRVPRTH